MSLMCRFGSRYEKPATSPQVAVLSRHNSSSHVCSRRSSLSPSAPWQIWQSGDFIAVPAVLSGHAGTVVSEQLRAGDSRNLASLAQPGEPQQRHLMVIWARVHGHKGLGLYHSTATP
jgi:hypothetical protein